MPMPNGPAGPMNRMPLTESSAASALSGMVTEADICRLVDSFYETIREDDLLGPIFEQHVEDWSRHLPKMYRFWSTIALRTGLYAGRPIETHEDLPGLTYAHFDRWLRLWERTVAQTIHSDAQMVFVRAAQRMARSMASRLIA